MEVEWLVLESCCKDDIGLFELSFVIVEKNIYILGIYLVCFLIKLAFVIFLCYVFHLSTKLVVSSYTYDSLSIRYSWVVVYLFEDFGRIQYWFSLDMIGIL